ncbi:MAG TPA: MXAN_5187 C-terminal domain-containing protein [Candidatus Angelobacter sp.]
MVYSGYLTPNSTQVGRELLAVAIDDDLTQLDEFVRRLKVEYDVYFGGGSKKPPAETEWKVRNLLRKHSDGSNMNSGQRFRFNTIQQRYALFAALWQQKLKIKEEGYRRPQDAVLGIQGLRTDQQHEAEAALKHPDSHRNEHPPAGFRIDCGDAEAEPQKVEALFQALAQARAQAGESGGGTLASFRKFVRQKTSQIRQEYGCATVEYSVEVRDGQVRLKAKPKTS